MYLVDKTFAKFIMVGLINTGVGMAIMFGLYNLLGAGYWVSSMTNNVLGSILSFFLNKYFTFGVKHWSVFMIIAFASTIIFSYLIAYGIAKPAMNYILRDSPLKVRENAALLIGMCLFTGINYVGQRLVVFKADQPRKEEK